MNDFIENILDKKEELCKLFENYLYEIHQKDNGEYAYLQGDNICISVRNIDKSKVLYIDFDDEFTLTFNAFHSHYDCFEKDYGELVTDIKKILENEIGSATIYHYYGGKLNWLSSCLISVSEAESQPVKQIFSYELRNKDLEQYGGEVCYQFWDSRLDRTIKIEKKADY